jgi:hypothetical protein
MGITQHHSASLSKEKHMNDDHRIGPAPGRVGIEAKAAGRDIALPPAAQASAKWLAAALAACCLAGVPALAQQAGTPPKPTAGEGQGPRQDGTTRSGAPAPMPSASAAASGPQSARQSAPHSERGQKPTRDGNQGTSTPRPSDSGSILGTPK